MTDRPTASHLEGRVVAVTGAAGGFGRLVCTGAAVRGAKVVAIDLDGDGAAELAASIEADGGEALAITADVTDLGQVKGAVAAALERFGSLDVMVNNAGVMPLAFFTDHEAAADAWSRCIDINIKGVLNGMIAAHDPMLAQGRGHVVNLSSIYGNFPVVGAAVYGATKAAVNMLSESFRVETQGKIKVTIVKPTGVPATGLGAGVINREAAIGILGQNWDEYVSLRASGEADLDPESIGYAVLGPEHIADAILHAIDQPDGVSIGDITIRAAGDRYIL